ncbi:glucanotransferase domain of glycogen debranching enzyme-domain-containing protein [Phascolomyces articulosus]|uniref:Glycogen debranching enzyme n=1 Tax=Phascolomyces articulosus TaxID=60185 RepID=A0AAD5KA55_9FUNG|nr:glucanotransferase domain of glycogen debranching enzyme-domain-containing protein [Phascolomyces articulosus]
MTEDITLTKKFLTGTILPLLYALPLEDDGSPDNAKTYVRIPLYRHQSCHLRFMLKKGSMAANNQPMLNIYQGSTFAYSVPFHADQHHCDIELKTPGAYAYHVSFMIQQKDKDNMISRKGDTGYFVVEPRLYNDLPLDAVMIESVIPKWMGPLSQWQPHIDLIKQSGYNMIHFAPMQQRGGSDSPYSIHDQLLFADDLFHSNHHHHQEEEEEDYVIVLPEKQERIDLVRSVLHDIQTKHGIMCLSDVVWNHTSYDSPFLIDHPDAGYNLENSPHLVPAYELDTALVELSKEMDNHGLPRRINTVQDVEAIVSYIKKHIFPRLQLWEYKTVDITPYTNDAIKGILLNPKSSPMLLSYQQQLLLQQKQDHNETTTTTTTPVLLEKNQPIDILANLFGQFAMKDTYQPGIRGSRSLDLTRAISFVQAMIKMGYRLVGVDKSIVIASSFSSKNDDNNKDHDNNTKVDKNRKDDTENDNDNDDNDINNVTTVIAIFNKLLSQYNLVQYQEYDQDVEIALENIRSRMIYTRLDETGPCYGEINASCPIVESYFTRLDNKIALANNGWIWNADPMQDFAGPESSAYLRRQVICWGDCVKLRYGKSPNDNPWLWNHMREYTELVATLFDGVRIDNCHSTPIHVAEYLLNAARHVRPDLYVLAELFTGSPEMDLHFVSKLGIHALVREAMQAWDPHELSRLVHRHGGKPVGSMDQDLNWRVVPFNTPTFDGAQQSMKKKKNDQKQKALLIPIEHASPPRALFMDCTHDNQTPFQKRTAQDTLPNAALVAFSDCATGSVKGYDEIYPYLLDVVEEKRLYSTFLQHPVGIVDFKAQLQKLHLSMSLEGFTEVHVHHEGDYIMVHRQHPETHEGYLLIAHTSFPSPSKEKIKPIRLHMTQLSYVFGASLKVESLKDGEDEKNNKYLMGLASQCIDLPSPRLIQEQDDTNDNIHVTIELPKDGSFGPGSIYVFKTSIGEQLDEEIERLVTHVPDTVIEPLDLLDCNVVLYRCEGEELDATGGNGVYDIPGWGKLPYAGLEGFMSVLRPIVRDNDLGHPFCDNLRRGSWAMDYVQNRLKSYPHCQPLVNWFTLRFDTIQKKLPDFLIPKYFAITIHSIYQRVCDHALSKMSPLVYDNLDPFVHRLALCTVQMYGNVPSTGLYPCHHAKQDEEDQVPIGSLAAGLPHFSHGYMRTWGRDVFISLRGLLLVTGQYEAAKQHILAFAATLNHGIMPNLLDAGRSPRYNARDAVWFFMQSVQDYYHIAPNGPSILQERVKRRFPKDYTHVPVDQGYTWECTIAELVQEILQQHAQGIHFREHNAGKKIDSQMRDQGFNIDITVDWDSGVLVGGNIWNCGTWMDKMGESEKAGNKGYPGTPRDGAPIEITGLLKSSLRWVLQLYRKKQFSWTGVEVDNKTITYKEWNDLLQKNFERVYYIPRDPSQDKNYKVDSKIIHRRGIYKDVYKATWPYTEYQFRPNLSVAMVVAPELFDPIHATECLQLMNQVLLGPLGMKTLDPADKRYRPFYNNSEDSEDFDTSKGRNYHQGPEWVWPTGYYLRAAHQFGTLTPPQIARILRHHREHIQSSIWAGLPELTNKDGETCWDSCFTQAWSASGLLDLIFDMQQQK